MKSRSFLWVKPGRFFPLQIVGILADTQLLQLREDGMRLVSRIHPALVVQLELVDDTLHPGHRRLRERKKSQDPLVSMQRRSLWFRSWSSSYFQNFLYCDGEASCGGGHDDGACGVRTRISPRYGETSPGDDDSSRGHRRTTRIPWSSQSAPCGDLNEGKIKVSEFQAVLSFAEKIALTFHVEFREDPCHLFGIHCGLLNDGARHRRVHLERDLEQKAVHQITMYYSATSIQSHTHIHIIGSWQRHSRRFF